MALTQYETRRPRTGNPTRDGRGRHHGQVQLAEVLPIRPTFLSLETGDGGRMAKLAQVFASLRAQTMPGDTPPRPPASSAPLLHLLTHAAAPDDAA